MRLNALMSNAVSIEKLGIPQQYDDNIQMWRYLAGHDLFLIAHGRDAVTVGESAG